MSVWRGIRKIKIRPVATGAFGVNPLNLFELLQILFCQENFLLENIVKTLTPKNVTCPPKPLDLGYGSCLSERSKRNRSKLYSQTNRQLNKDVDRMWNMTKWNSHSCFCLLADLYTWASMHSEWDLNAKKLYRIPITASCRVCHCYIHCA